MEERICRICLIDEKSIIRTETQIESDTQLLDVYETKHFHLWTVSTPHIFLFCTSLRAAEGDGLSELICGQCLNMLNKFYDFKCLATKSDKILRNKSCEKIKSESSIDVAQVDLDLDQNSSPLLHFDCDIDDDDTFSNHAFQNDAPERNKLKNEEKTHKFKKKKKLLCASCPKGFNKPEKLESHMKSHLGTQNVRVTKYVCHECGVKFVQADNLRTHLLLHTQDKIYACNQCGKKFIQPGNLKTHLIRHTGIKNIQCTLCDMQFYVKGDLDKHMRSHSDNKPHSCKTCGKAFKTQSFLIVHNRTHTGERPFVCDLCPKNFMCRKDLRNHRMTHTGEKPHKCKVCNQAFIQKCALNRHMKTHDKSQKNVNQIIQSQSSENLNLF